MSAHLLLRAFVNERLTAAAEEIFRVFDETIARYEEEASSSRQEIQRLSRLLLQSVSSNTTDVQNSSICQEETPEQQELNLSLGLEDSEPQDIKEEDHDLWLPQRQEEEQQRVGHIKEEEQDVWDGEQQDEDEEERDYSEMPSQLCTENSDSEESRPARPGLARTSASQSVQVGRKNTRPTLSLTNQTETEQSRNAFVVSAGLSDLNTANTPEHRCRLCDKTFASGKFLTNHALRVHSRDEGALCAVCGRTCESAQGLAVHLQTHGGSNQCPMCGRRCSSASALSEHVASHGGLKLHCCPVCGRECSRKGDLKIHMRIHTGEKPFRCSLCHKTFTHSGHLRKHMRIHTGERPHRCQVCGRGFMQSVHLKYHMSTHVQKY